MGVGIRTRVSRACTDTHFRWRDLCIAVVSIFVVYLVLRTESSAQAAWDELLAFISGLAVFAVALIIEFGWNVAVAPYRIRIESLEAEVAAVKPEPPLPAASLHFGDPKLYPNESVTEETVAFQRRVTFGTSVRLWRVDLTNREPGTKAENVAVRLVETIPDLGLPPIDLHETHDNTPPYKTRRDVRHGEPISFDVIAFEGDPDSEIFLYRSDLGSSYTHRLSDGERQVVRKTLREQNGIVLVLRAVADPPASGHLMSYRVFLSEKRQFVMEPDSYIENAI